jgi:hypothetical protein
MRHHMAPMAGCVTNAEENGFIFVAGELQGLLTPWKPVHRVFSMLQQIWRRFMDELVCHGDPLYRIMMMKIINIISNRHKDR